MNEPQGEVVTGTSDASRGQVTRRAVLIGASLAGAAVVAHQIGRRRQSRQNVFIARNQRYAGDLARTIRDGLAATGFETEKIRGRRVLLKPNMVEPNRGLPQMTTHPAVVVAAAEVFRGFGAEVVVGEAPGHMRDTEMALAESRLGPALDEAGIRFADLNYEEVRFVANAGGACKLDGFWFPKSVLEADLVVSMPKMKTHHWVGFTSALKNMYGVIPGIKYGWPKNVLHYAGIPETVVDINASLPPTLAIVDGIECMEGDGPILGSPKPMGLILVGPNATAVDATVGRIMGLRPERAAYLNLAGDRLGPIEDSLIDQCGERWEPLVSPFKILDRPHLRHLRPDATELISGRWSVIGGQTG